MEQLAGTYFKRYNCTMKISDEEILEKVIPVVRKHNYLDYAIAVLITRETLPQEPTIYTPDTIENKITAHVIGKSFNQNMLPDGYEEIWDYFQTKYNDDDENGIYNEYLVMLQTRPDVPNEFIRKYNKQSFYLIDEFIQKQRNNKIKEII